MPHRTTIYVDDMVLFIHPAVADLLLTRGIFTLFEGVKVHLDPRVGFRGLMTNNYISNLVLRVL
jgi:hypothetical protein